MIPRAWACLAFLACFALCGCASSDKFTVERLDGPVSLERTIEYTSFWEAMEGLDLSYPAEKHVPREGRWFADGLRLVMEGRMAEAEAAFIELRADCKDPELRKSSADVLAEILFSQAKWEEFVEFYEALPPEELDPERDNTSYVFSKAMAGLPREEYVIPAEPSVVPTEWVWDLPKIAVEVNGRREEFILDTGASVTVLASDVALRCGVKALGTESAQGHTSTSIMIEARPALIDELSLGDIRITNHPAAILSESDMTIAGVKLAGIIGWPVFQRLVVEIDYENETTTFSRPTHRGEGERNLFWLGYPMVVLRSDEGVPLYFGLDTGARNTSIKENIFKKVNVGQVRHVRGISVGAGGSERVTKKEVKDLSLVWEPYIFHFEEIRTGTGVKGAVVVEPDGKLGGNLARGGRIIIDYPNGRADILLPE